MKTIKTYESFCDDVNEEINLRKAAAGIALGAGLAFGNPVIGQTTDNQTTSNTQKLDKISGFKNYKLGDTTIYGNKVSSLEKLNQLNREFEVYSGVYDIKGKYITWYEKKESLFSNTIIIYFGYIDDKLMGIYIETPYLIKDDVLLLIESKFGQPRSFGHDRYKNFWNINNTFLIFDFTYNTVINTSGSGNKTFSSASDGPNSIMIYNQELKNTLLDKLKIEKEEKMKKINSETF